jgi:hypothetical protein
MHVRLFNHLSKLVAFRDPADCSGGLTGFSVWLSSPTSSFSTPPLHAHLLCADGLHSVLRWVMLEQVGLKVALSSPVFLSLIWPPSWASYQLYG